MTTRILAVAVLLVACVSAEALDLQDKNKASDKFKANRQLNKQVGARLGSGMIAYFGLVFLLRSIYNFTLKQSPAVLNRFNSKLVRRIRANVMLPPTFRLAHSAPHYIGRFSLMIPTRDQTLILVGYGLFWFISAFVGYKFVTPDGTVTVEFVVQHSRMVGDRMATLCMFQLPLLILLGGRNDLFMYLTGWPLDTFNVFHKWIARMWVLGIVTHAICFTISYRINGNYFPDWTTANIFFRWGVCGGIIACFMVFFATHYFRSRHYELFLVSHIIMAIAFLMCVYWHVKPNNWVQNAIAACCVWGFDRLIRFIRLAVSGLNSTAEITYHEDGNVLKIKVDYSKWWKPYPGCYVFVHFLTPTRFWQAHPFTVLRAVRDEDEGSLMLHVRAKHGITDFLKNKALQDDKTHTITMPVAIEGPLGASLSLSRYSQVIMFAGGIGITGVYTYAQDLLAKSTQQRIVLNWVVADKSPLVWFRDQLAALAADSRFEVNVYVKHTVESEDDEIVEQDMMLAHEGKTKEKVKESKAEPNSPVPSEEPYQMEKALEGINVVYCRADIPALTRSFMATASNATAFVVCGPGMLNDEVRRTVADNLVATEARVDYFEESFSW